METLRRVRAGEEIFVSYGTDYWPHARAMSHSTADVPEWEWDLSDPFAVSAPVLHGPTASAVPDAPPAPPVAVSVSASPVSAPIAAPSTAPASVAPDEIMPPPSKCEVHVGLESPDCSECVPGLLVCRDHYMACGGESHLLHLLPQGSLCPPFLLPVR